MRITFPENKRFEEYLEGALYKCVDGKNKRVTYQGIFGFTVDRHWLTLNAREFAKFCRNIEVMGGHKKKAGDHITVTPKRTVVICVRVSDFFRDLLINITKKLRYRPTIYARTILLEALATNIERFGLPDKSKMPRISLYKDERPIGNAPVTIRFSDEEYDLLRKVAECGGQTPQQYARMALGSNLLAVGRTLGLVKSRPKIVIPEDVRKRLKSRMFEKPQTSET